MADVSWLDVSKLALSSVTTLVATAGGWFALRNWRLGEANRKLSLDNARLAEQWKRADLAASYLQPLFEDDNLLFALRCIDWGVGNIPVPERHRDSLDTKTRTISHDPALLERAMIPVLQADVAQSSQGMLYRLTLDSLFTRLDWIGHRVARGLISIDDVPDLKYWMEMLAKWPYVPDVPAGRQRAVFIPFLAQNGYGKVIYLIEGFNTRTIDPNHP